MMLRTAAQFLMTDSLPLHEEHTSPLQTFTYKKCVLAHNTMRSSTCTGPSPKTQFHGTATLYL